MAPISTAMPTENDHRQTEKLKALLQKLNSYPPKEESIQREMVLGKLNLLVREWVKQVGMKLGLPEQMAEDAGAKLVTFGSYRLGVHGPGADIDTLCIAPRHVTRDHYFGEFREMLLAQPETSELTAVRETHVPVIKMVFDGIQIDLLFAQLDMSAIPEDLDVLDENNLRNVDEETQRSLDGPRVADEILRLVPNVDNFRTTLRCVKIWATNRAVYGNVVGYLGGIAWALLVANICQLYPNALPNMLLSRFFWIYQKWNWPNPILLKPIEERQLRFQVWNPKIHHRDARDLMPIITPAYPSKNSTYNVSRTTLRIMKNEFTRGSELAFKAEEEQKEWEVLFEETDFFVRYKRYLQLEVSSENEEDHRAWIGYIESRLRHFIISVERITNLINVLLHPYPGYFTNPDAPIPTTYFYIGLDYQQNRFTVPAKVDLTPAAKRFYMFHIDHYSQRKETQHKPMITSIKRSQIPTFVISEEKRKEMSRRMLKRRRDEEAALQQTLAVSEIETVTQPSAEVQESPYKSSRLDDISNSNSYSRIRGNGEIAEYRDAYSNHNINDDNTDDITSVTTLDVVVKGTSEITKKRALISRLQHQQEQSDDEDDEDGESEQRRPKRQKMTNHDNDDSGMKEMGATVTSMETEEEKVATIERFSQLDLVPELKQAIADVFHEFNDIMTPIQISSIPAALQANGTKDIIVQVITGSGKTIAFLVPVLNQLCHSLHYQKTDSNSDISNRKEIHSGIAIVVLSPVRELVLQIHRVVQKLLNHDAIKCTFGIRTGFIMGGINKNKDIEVLKSAHVLVATPARLAGHVNSGTVDMSSVQTFVLDEADKLMTRKFEQQIRQIMAQLPRDRTTMLFSSTRSSKIKELVNILSLRPDPIKIGFEESNKLGTLEQRYVHVRADKKIATLLAIVHAHRDKDMIIFTAKKASAKFICAMLNRCGIEASELRSDMSQSKKTSNFRDSGKKSGIVLIATDVAVSKSAACGLDIPGFDLVIQADLPNKLQQYFHRVDLTARSGKEGTSLLMFNDTEIKTILRKLKSHLSDGMGEKLLKYNLPAGEDELDQYQQQIIDAVKADPEMPQLAKKISKSRTFIMHDHKHYFKDTDFCLSFARSLLPKSIKKSKKKKRKTPADKK